MPEPPRTTSGRWPVPVILGAVTAAALLVACDAREAGQDAGAPDTAEARPASTADTILIEGMEEEIRLSLFRTPAEFPLPFSAYVPEGLSPEVLESDSGGAVRFVAELGGVRNELALLHMHVYPEGTTAGEVVPAVRAFAVSRGIPVSRGEGDEEPQRPRRFEWSLVEYAFEAPGATSATGEQMLGSVAVGRHGDRFFHVLLQYPPEYEEGFVPRARKVLETLRWEDTAEGLEGGALAPG